MTATDLSTESATTFVPTPTTSKPKRLICIRHARSEGNEFMARPGNEWGDPSFCDDATLIDAKLTEAGLLQVKKELLTKFMASNDNDSNCEAKPEYAELLQDIDLVVVSPLTRTQETFQYGVLPALQHVRANNLPRVLAHPLSTERVYTASDTGRNVEYLAKEFPFSDWSLVREYPHKEWWYNHKHDPEEAASYKEWRPFGDGQWYAVPGEPTQHFLQRMKALEDWIASRDEHTIMLVAHWGVMRYLLGGYSAENCEVKVLDNWTPLHQNLSPGQTLEEQETS